MEYHILPVTPFAQNCTVWICPQSRAAAVIDPGGEAGRIRALLDEQQARVEAILLTHGHLDHVGAASELARQLGVPIHGPHVEDAFLLQALPQQAEMFGFPPAQAFTPDHWLAEGERIRFGQQQVEVLHCPGHTPGHVVFYHREAQLAQVGDVLFKGSIGRTDFPRGNHTKLLASIRDKLLPLGAAVRFIPGHGPMSTLGHEAAHNPYLVQ